MNKTIIAAAFAGALFVTALTPQAAYAQTGDEIRGQSVRVDFADGTSNTVNFGADGTARILAADGTAVDGNWFVQGQQICLQTAAARECWPYTAAFQAGVPVQLTSDCASTSTWTALSTNMPMPPAGTGERGGERG